MIWFLYRGTDQTTWKPYPLQQHIVIQRSAIQQLYNRSDRVSWKKKTPKTPQDPPWNDSQLYWLGLGDWVKGQFVQYNNLNGTWLTQFPNSTSIKLRVIHWGIVGVFVFKTPDQTPSYVCYGCFRTHCKHFYRISFTLSYGKCTQTKWTQMAIHGNYLSYQVGRSWWLSYLYLYIYITIAYIYNYSFLLSALLFYPPLMKLQICNLKFLYSEKLHVSIYMYM